MTEQVIPERIIENLKEQVELSKRIIEDHHSKYAAVRLAELSNDLIAWITREGSLSKSIEIESDALPEVRERINGIRINEAPTWALDAYAGISALLKRDRASAVLLPPESAAPVLIFPGEEKGKEKALVYGPFNQDATIDGFLIRIGGESDPVPVHIREAEGKPTYICEARHDVAIDLAPHYMKDPLRVKGTGRWFRDESGEWIMKRFTIVDFVVLTHERLSNALTKLRAISKEWPHVDDPITEIMESRRDETPYTLHHRVTQP